MTDTLDAIAREMADYANALAGAPRSPVDDRIDAWAGRITALSNQGEGAWESSYAEYDRAIHSNPDAKAWADFFVATFPGQAAQHELMLAWFANAMMAMHDHLMAKPEAEADRRDAERLDWLELNLTLMERVGAGFELDSYDEETKESYFTHAISIRDAIDTNIAATQEQA